MKTYTIFYTSSLGTVCRRIEVGVHKGLPFAVNYARQFSIYLTGELYPGEELKYEIYNADLNDVWHEIIT